MLVSQIFDTTAPLVSPLTAVAVIACCRLPQAARHGRSLDRALWLFAASYLIAAIAGLDPSRSLLLSAPTIPAIAMYLAMARGACKATVLAFLAVAGIAICVRVLASATTSYTDDAGELVRGLGIAWLVVPNDAMALACLFPSISLWLGLHMRKELAAVGAGVLVTAAASAVDSRVAIGACAAIVGIDLLAHGGRHRLCRPTIAFSVPVLCGLAAAAFATKGLRSLDARVELWQQAWCVFAQHPVLGVGPHVFEAARGGCFSSALADIDGRSMPWPHNLYLELAAETGLVGTAAAAMVFLAAVRLAVARRTERDMTEILLPTSILLVVLLGGLIETTLLRAWVWSLGALALGWLRSCGGQLRLARGATGSRD